MGVELGVLCEAGSVGDLLQPALCGTCLRWSKGWIGVPAGMESMLYIFLQLRGIATHRITVPTLLLPFLGLFFGLQTHHFLAENHTMGMSIDGLK